MTRSFTLESDKARQKLQEFAVTHPEHFQLLALAGMFALGARNLEIVSDADDWTVTSRDPAGGWSYHLRFRKGELTKTGLRDRDHQQAGTRIAAKRKGFGQVARGF